ncbi:MAG: superoxide dismutase, Ni [Chloroflexi bacterium]|nr:superoxide dismutase, Ni [Chloroflexota bacterium]MDA1228044.1 superoxide dismutase, Ni [Chloroflexota bacterium]
MKLRQLLPYRIAEAHCDVPCGIYDPVSAKIAAQTVLKMTMRIQGLEGNTSGSPQDRQTYANNIGRYVVVKEEHATVAKKELDILWHDYFRPDHLEAYPDLHTKFWMATKLASQAKQAVNLEAAQQLVAAVDDIAKIFWATKGVEYSDPNSAVRFGA